MSGFDTIIVVDWSAASKRSPARPSKDAIWIGSTGPSGDEAPVYCRSRIEAEDWLTSRMTRAQASGERILVCFDFPFGYPRGFARQITGSDDPFALWDWLGARIEDAPDGRNNRFDVAETLNACFDGPGPFWGKSHKDKWPGIPYRKEGIRFAPMAERRLCDTHAGTSSSCFQLYFNPTVGSQALMGLPMLARLRRKAGARVWPFEACDEASLVMAEIWPGLIEPAVQAAPADEIRDSAQVRLLAHALAMLPAGRLDQMMADIPERAREEGWVLGTGHAAELTAHAALRPLGPLAPPPLSNDCFALPPGVDWQPVDAALGLLKNRLTCVAQPEMTPLQDLPGRILAEDLSAARSNPPLPNTAVDGYGFAHAALGPPPHNLPLVRRARGRRARV